MTSVAGYRPPTALMTPLDEQSHPHAQRPDIPRRLVDTELIDADHRLPDRAYAECGVRLRRMPQLVDYHRRWRAAGPKASTV